MGKWLRAMPAEYPLVRQELLPTREENADWGCEHTDPLTAFGFGEAQGDRRAMHEYVWWRVDGGKGKGERDAGGVGRSALGDNAIATGPRFRMRGWTNMTCGGRFPVWERSRRRWLALHRKSERLVTWTRWSEADRDAAKFGSAGVMMVKCVPRLGVGVV
ncbi:hypothetical protein GGP41_010071 [Bipolaris sorokiniana]|uniref:Uncharacterized protein n=1 Tax=Cochliobolus sativus TaxID=45130 RepID=A0A8H5ZGY3_COCSA|nr:hypothetical protein GGP41_010071 [Bipolaris sorokiniana]